MGEEQDGDSTLRALERSVIERLLGDALAQTNDPSGLWQIRPVVVDTNVFLQDIVYRLSKGRGALLEAARFGSIRLFASSHVLEEVEKNLEGYCQRGAQYLRALSLWRDAYLPWIRWVIVPDDIADERIRAVLAVHPADAPTAALACLIAPCWAFSEDKHLRKRGLGRQDWRSLSLQGRDIARTESAMIGAYWLGASLVIAVVSSIRGIARSRLGPLAPVVLTATGLYLTRRGLISRESTSRLLDRMRLSVRALAAGVSTVTTIYQESRDGLALAIIEPSGPPDLRRSVAYILARAPTPLSGKAISDEMRHLGIRVPPKEVNRVLRSCPAFVEVRRYAWQVGM